MDYVQKWEFVEVKKIKMNNFDILKIRKDFPIINKQMNGQKLVYLDNAATTQKPQKVIDSIVDCYSNYNANIHRGVYSFSQQTTEKYEQARKLVSQYINSKSTKEIIFTHGATESINLVAQSYGKLLKKGDEIIISEMEHHANIVPWLILKQQIGIEIKYIPINTNYSLDIETLNTQISNKTKLISVVHISNTLGTINNVEEIINIGHKKGIPVMIDASQSIQHLDIDVQKLNCDFLAFSGHKIYAETGIGVLYAKEEFLSQMPPYQLGGDMIEDVDFETVTFAQIPTKFEAGTTNYVGAISLGAAIEYIQSIGLNEIAEYEKKLHNYLIEKIKIIDDIELYLADNQNACSVVSFNIKTLHHEDIGTLLNNFGIAVRTGGHCTYPLLKKLKLTGTVRASVAFYNTFEEIDFFVEKLKKVILMLK